MDDLRTVAELAGIDARHARARTLMLIASPADSAIIQNDCDCACPAVPVSAAPARRLHEQMRLRLHPQARFVELRSEANPHPPTLSPKAGEGGNLLPFPPAWGKGLGDGASPPYLLFIPSILSGVVVSRELRDSLLIMGGVPMPLADLRAGMPQELIERCFALGILVDDQPPAPCCVPLLA